MTGSEAAVKTRFAPSPTGRMHVGNARTALFNYLFARHLGGRFVLRMEDTDPERSQEVFVQALEEDLRWMGLAWDEGPDIDGGHGPYRQSQRTALYQDYYRRLDQAGHTYPCYCSPQELALSRKRQLATGRPPRYEGTCAHLSEAERQARLSSGRQPTIRFRVPAGEQIQFEDLVRGTQVFETDHIGDFIIRRADGTFAFFFCNALDDALMGITHVLRGEDHLTNTPRQQLILNALALPIPGYGHLPLIVGADGAPLSKRNGSRSVAELREEGFLAVGINNYLSRLGHRLDDEALLEPDLLAKAFDLGAIGRSPSRFDENHLRHWQKLAVAAVDDATLVAWAGDALARVPPPARQAFFEVVRPNATFPDDIGQWADLIYGQLSDWTAAGEILKEAGPDFFRAAVEALDTHGSDASALTTHVKAVTGKRGRSLFMPLRLALTMREDGPEFRTLLALIPAEEVRRRLEACAQIAASGS